MKKFFLALALLSMLFTALPNRMVAQDNPISSNAEQLFNGSDHYGVRISFSSSVQACLTPSMVPEKTFNVNGVLTAPNFQLQAGDTIVVGTFTRADSRQAWSAYVRYQYKLGLCN